MVGESSGTQSARLTTCQLQILYSKGEGRERDEIWGKAVFMTQNIYVSDVRCYN